MMSGRNMTRKSMNTLCRKEYEFSGAKYRRYTGSRNICALQDKKQRVRRRGGIPWSTSTAMARDYARRLSGRLE